MVAHEPKVCYNLLKDCPLRPFAGLGRRFGKSLNERGSAPCCTRIIDCAVLHFSFPGGIIVPKFQGHCRFADGGASFFGLRVL